MYDTISKYYTLPFPVFNNLTPAPATTASPTTTTTTTTTPAPGPWKKNEKILLEFIKSLVNLVRILSNRLNNYVKEYYVK